MPIAAPTEAVEATTLAGSAPIHDFSMIDMFMQADYVVKTVIIVLFIASFWSWAIIIEKSFRFKAVKWKANTFEKAFWSAESLDAFYERVKKRANHPFAIVFVAAMEEWLRSSTPSSKGRKPMKGSLNISLQERMVQIMSVTRNRELDHLERGLGFLATVGTSAPFIGLFGTVWGIMNSFQSIAMSKNTSLAVVAPGIAEALFATAIGLFAAIPAVIAYNKYSNELGKFAGRLEDYSVEFSALLSRQTDANTKRGA